MDKASRANQWVEESHVVTVEVHACGGFEWFTAAAVDLGSVRAREEALCAFA